MAPSPRSNTGGARGALGLAAVVGALALGGVIGGRQASGGAAQDPTQAPAVVSTAATTSAASATDLDAVAVVERVTPAVVTVNNLQQLGGGLLGGGGGAAQPAGAGTGFVLDDQGYIVTNEHVVRGGDEFEVVFADGEQRPATLIGSDPLADLAVVQIEGALPGTLTLGDSDALRVGQPVLAVGSPLGEFTTTVTQGIVSALNRDFPIVECQGIYTNLVQHDAAINPGNSGGPLFNAAGEVVGVNTLGIPGAQGLYFAVPASTVRDITTEIIEDGQVDYPLFGVAGVGLNEVLAAQENLPVDFGHYVTEVTPGGAAAEAGIEDGDIILTVDGQRIDERNTFTEALFAHEPGETVDVTLRRGDEETTAQVTLDRREELLPPQCFAENIGP